MNSAESVRPRPLGKILSGILLAGSLILLKTKAFLIIVVDFFRGYAVNPFEGFGVVQYLLAAGTLALSIGAYATKAPLSLGIGVVVVTLIHEIGHAVAIRAKKLRAGVMVFIPFVGGAVTLKEQPRSAYDDAQIGLAGPIFGTAACLIVLQIFKWTGDTRWLMIAAFGFALNLINLLPIGMLDGGRISGAVTKWMWVLGGGALVYKAYQQPNPLIILVLLLVAFQVYASIVREDDESFYDVTIGQRAGIAAAYFILVVFLGHQTYLAFSKLIGLPGR